MYKLLRNNLLTVYILAIVVAIVMFPNFMIDGHKSPDTTERPIFSSSEATILGIDISRHNGEIDWPEVTSHKMVNRPLHFVVIKATEGGDLVDPLFADNWKNANKHGLVRGAYHFFTSFTDPDVQAINYLSTVKHKRGDLVPVLDFENDGKTYLERQHLSKNAHRWLKIIERELGKKPIIYTNHLIYNKYIKNKIKGYGIWLADYTVHDATIFDIENLLMWQHSDGGVIPGIEETVDLNVFYGSPHKFQKYLFQ